MASHRACFPFRLFFIRLVCLAHNRQKWISRISGRGDSKVYGVHWGDYVDRQDRQVNMGAQNQLGEARDTLPLTTGASKAFLSRTENNRETRSAGQNGVHLRTLHIRKGFQNSRYSWMEEGLLRLISRASLSRLTDGGEKKDGMYRPTKRQSTRENG